MSTDVGSFSTSFGMSTEITHRVFGKQAEAALKAVDREAKRLEKLLSCYVPESEIYRLNKSAGIKSEQLSFDTFDVLSTAAQFSKYSQGLFDVTIGPLVRLWDYKHSKDIPDKAQIRRAISLVNYTYLILDPQRKTAFLQKAGQSVDLGGIGKGFICDKLLDIFRKFGVLSAYTNIGGNVAVLGTKLDGSPWRVGIRDPRQEKGLIGVLSVADKAVVTSGDDQRYFIDRVGKRRHHILNPNTGYPSESGLISATIVADSATTADALSTPLFIAGMEKGLKWLENFPGTEAVLVTADFRVIVTQGLKDHFQARRGIKANILD